MLVHISVNYATNLILECAKKLLPMTAKPYVQYGVRSTEYPPPYSPVLYVLRTLYNCTIRFTFTQELAIGKFQDLVTQDHGGMRKNCLNNVTALSTIGSP